MWRIHDTISLNYCLPWTTTLSFFHTYQMNPHRNLIKYEQQWFSIRGDFYIPSPHPIPRDMRQCLETFSVSGWAAETGIYSAKVKKHSFYWWKQDLRLSDFWPTYVTEEAANLQFKTRSNSRIHNQNHDLCKLYL